MKSIHEQEGLETTVTDGVEPAVGTVKGLNVNANLVKALMAINRYRLAEDSYDHRCYSRAERENAQSKQRECLLILADIDDPLVQAITTTLSMEKHSLNAGVLIRKLLDKVAL